MWLRRTKTTRYQTFACSSFKDIESLFPEQNNENNNNNNNRSTSSSINSTPPNKSQIRNVFHRVRRAKSLFSALSNQQNIQENVQESLPTLKSLHKDDEVVVLDVDNNNVVDGAVLIELPGTETRVVIFFTSLRVVRTTFEDCKYVRSILHSFRVEIDERDLFMDGRFMKELQRIMGNCEDEKTNLTLPRVFIGGRYIGGAEEIRQLHEGGELKKYLQGMAPAAAGTCEVCGGHGFILCLECNGSHKCYVEKGGFKTCTVCNENGLVRCPSCSSAPL